MFNRYLRVIAFCLIMLTQLHSFVYGDERLTKRKNSVEERLNYLEEFFQIANSSEERETPEKRALPTSEVINYRRFGLENLWTSDVSPLQTQDCQGSESGVLYVANSPQNSWMYFPFNDQEKQQVVIVHVCYSSSLQAARRELLLFISNTSMPYREQAYNYSLIQEKIGDDLCIVSKLNSSGFPHGKVYKVGFIRHNTAFFIRGDRFVGYYGGDLMELAKQIDKDYLEANNRLNSTDERAAEEEDKKTTSMLRSSIFVCPPTSC